MMLRRTTSIFCIIVLFLIVGCNNRNKANENVSTCNVLKTVDLINNATRYPSDISFSDKQLIAMIGEPDFKVNMSELNNFLDSKSQELNRTIDINRIIDGMLTDYQMHMSITKPYTVKMSYEDPKFMNLTVWLYNFVSPSGPSRVHALVFSKKINTYLSEYFLLDGTNVVGAGNIMQSLEKKSSQERRHDDTSIIE